MINKLNKGEWAEFYAFLKILSTGELYAADKNGNKDNNKFYYILSAIKNDIEYSRNKNINSLTFEINNQKISIPFSYIDELLDSMFLQIKQNNRTFEIPIINPLIDKLHIKNIKQKSSEKGDIRLRVHDSLTSLEPIHSFSIKSYIGGSPTLLNASRGTIFSYIITPPLQNNIFEKLNNLKSKNIRGWLDKLIQNIYENNSKCKYSSVSSDVFLTNLMMIDFRLPEILGEVFLHGYLVDNKNLDLSVNSYLQDNQNEIPHLIKYKINELLIASALGMVPMTQWLGFEETNGGYIIVKDNSEVLCYHLYERNELKDYLYYNTRFETASTSRYNTGFIYSKNGNQYIDLALQIRFI